MEPDSTDLTRLAPYDELKRAVLRAGFFNTYQGFSDDNGIENDAVCFVCASRNIGGAGVGGTSFWIFEREGKWYLGVWQGSVYRINVPERLSDLCIELLRRKPESTRVDIDEALAAKYEIELMEDDEVTAEFGF